MRTVRRLLLIGPLAAALACTDRSPTSPETAAASSASAASTTSSTATDRASILRPSRDARAHGVVSARRETLLPPGVWGSDQASLTIARGSATLRIFAGAVPPDGCYGSFGILQHEIPNGSFTLPGTFTQLTGFYPGHIDDPAQFTGSVEGPRMTIAIAVAGQPGFLGPYVLTEGVSHSWGPCLYP